MSNCKHIYGILWSLFAKVSTKLLYSKKDIEDKNQYLWENPYAPLRIQKFQYCPTCGTELK
jgi:hypothetical protein